MNNLLRTQSQDFSMKEESGVITFNAPLESLDFNGLSERQLDMIGLNYNMTKISRLSQQNFLSQTESGKLKQSLHILKENFEIYKKESEKKINQTRAISANKSATQDKEINELKQMFKSYVSEASIDANEQDKIVSVVNDRANELLEDVIWLNYLKKKKTDKKENLILGVKKRCYSSIYKQYNVTSYRNLKKKDVDKAIEFISKWTPTKF